MRYATVLTLAIGLSALTAFAPGGSLQVSSPAFENHGKVPSRYTCEGEEASPPLNIANMPARTKSLAIVMHDPDANVTGGFTHWVKWNVDPMTSIPENYEGGRTGMTTIAQHKYIGMCPPSGTHHYVITVYALDTKMNLDINTDKASLEKKIRGHILAEGSITGLYEKMK
jgi:hypothetical protein